MSGALLHASEPGALPAWCMFLAAVRVGGEEIQEKGRSDKMSREGGESVAYFNDF